MKRRAATGLLSLLVIGLICLGVDCFQIGSDSGLLQPSAAPQNSSAFSPPTISVQTTLETEKLNSTISPSPRIIVSVTLNAGVPIESNAVTPRCVLIANFDATSCVSTSTGQWENSALEIVSSNPLTTITSLNLTGNGLQTISSWSTSLSIEDKVTFQHNYLPGATDLELQSANPVLLTLYPISNHPLAIANGQIYFYAISFNGGQIITGSVMAE